MIGEEIQTNIAPIYFWLPIAVVIAGNVLAFIYCQIKTDNSYIDVFWGLTFITPIVSLIIVRLVDGTGVNARMWLVFALITVWGVRLAIHIGIRHNGEDFRYKDMRDSWNKGGTCEYYTKAFFYIFILQAVFSLIVNAASLYVCIWSVDQTLIWLDYIGLAVWVFGFAFEIVGDEQLKYHLADKTPGKEKFIKWGLWRYTRHPNYFGEAVLWWGVWLIACSSKWGWATFFAPLFITILVRYISGVPLLERKYAGKPDWEQYCCETNVFFPWFVRKTNTNILPMMQPVPLPEVKSDL